MVLSSDMQTSLWKGASGVIDSGAEISIINGILFRKIAAVARLKRSQLKPPDRIPKTYDRKVFQLD